jgi:DNA sulfur modification protein DndD
MIFQQLVLENFRQFRGRQIINFSNDPLKNVTVIHGFNGSGKTTILNAFTWLFHKEFSSDFSNQDFLETEASFYQLRGGESLVTSVKLIFEDKERKYTAERTIILGKDDNGQKILQKGPELTLKYVDEKGESKEFGNPQDSLEQLLPKSLCPFFFFNGEQIEKLASKEAYEQIESGVKVLLDLEVFDRSISHLDGKIAKSLREEIAKHAGEIGEKTREDREKVEQAKLKIEQELQDCYLKLQSLIDIKNNLDAKITEIPDFLKLKAELEVNEKDLKNNYKQLADTFSNLSKLLSRHGYLALVPDVLEKARSRLSSYQPIGQLPESIKMQFIAELIQREECICGRSLLVGEHAYNCLLEWRDRLTSDNLDFTVSIAKSKLPSLINRRELFLKDFNFIKITLEELHEQKIRLEETLSELSFQIEAQNGANSAPDLAAIEGKRKEIEEAIINFNIAISKRKDALNKIEGILQKQDREIQNLQEVDAAGFLAQKRLDSILKVRLALEKIRQIRHQQLSRDLSKRLSEVWSRISIKDYQAKLDEQYHLMLTKKIGDNEELVRGASTGEKQVLSLAFIGSLLDKARSTYDENGDNNKSLLFKGGLYPLVIDSAFGQLEPEYKRDVAAWIPTLAPQVVVLVSESQWKHEVEQQLQEKIGAQWILQCHTSKKRGKNINLGNQEYQYVVESEDPFEQTKIVRVE